METEKNGMSFLTIIVSRKQKDAILTELHAVGLHLINTSYGIGTVNAHYLMKTFGIAPEKNKVVITSVSTDDKTDIFLKMLTEKFDFGKPNTGIAFTTPVDRVSY